MDSSIRFFISSALLTCALIGFLALEVNSEKVAALKGYKLPFSYRTITGHLHLLRQCRRQLTFIASVALGAFITRVIKDSPLTPLPLPPLENPIRWKFLTLPLRATTPYFKWMKEYAEKPHHHHQGFGSVPPSWHIHRTDNSIDDLNWRHRTEFRRDFSRYVKSTPHLIAKAISKTYASLRSSLTEDAEAKQWLMRWCH